MIRIKKAFVYFLIYVFTLQTLFAGGIQSRSTKRASATRGGIYYESSTISSEMIESNIIDGSQIESFKLRPISKGATYLNGKIYTGIELSCIRTGVITLTGEEDITDFFLDPIIGDEEYDVDWVKVISQFAVGTTVVFITGILHLSSNQTTPVFFAATGELFVGSLTGAISGAATDALIAGMLATFEGQPKEGVFKSTIEGAASGYMWGAIVGAVSGGLSGAGKITSTVNDDLARYLSKGTISLREGQVDELIKNSDMLEDVIKAYTGQKSVRDGFMEFFVRLAKGNPDQTRTLLENDDIYRIIARAIRAPGGKHEWLMVKNYMRFLVDPPANWASEDGLRAAVAINKLVQATFGEGAVRLRSGLTHRDGGRELALWHTELSKVIDESVSFNDAINDIYQFGKETLTAESALYLKEVIKSL